MTGHSNSWGSYGQCRFCRSEGNHRYLMKEYKNQGVSEVYYDLLQECFNLYLSTSARMSLLICGMCVDRLRDSLNFRKLVLASETHLTDTLDEKNSVFLSMDEPSTDLQMEIKSEPQTVVKKESEGGSPSPCDDWQEPTDMNDDNDNDNDFDNDDNDDQYDDEDATPLIKVQAAMTDEERLLARFPKLPPLPTRRTLHYICREFALQLDNLKDRTIKAQTIQSMFTEGYTNAMGSRIYITEKIAHTTNVITILENSNATAFQSKTRSGFPCLYCRKICETFEILRHHQDSDGCKTSLKKLLKKFTADCLVVYVYVQNLKCTLCHQNMPNLNELKTHLTRVHNKEMHLDFGDRVLPFKMSPTNEFECQCCGCNFETFGAIERHMNVHYRNFVCDQCGAGYVTKQRLKVHMKYTHETGRFPCESCKKVYDTRHKFRSHVDSVHKMLKKNKCPKCPERFADFFNKHKHMVEAHGLAPLVYKCNVCDSVFRRRYGLSLHMKRMHLDVRDVQCQICSYKCYTNTELKIHMAKHSSEKTYECTVCKKSYARNKTLKEHMRIHNNDRRYSCVVCGQAFVQNCSLKGHMKTHHLDYINVLQ
ncbi:uncharacterized protein [Epargyreus clarus]|uniref:uncharacterized protein n=1 Tax=Epargyreus clarus TaxID=520877 RepID=UPI003C2F5F4B